jgi:cytoskeletal protein RodZ
MNRIALVLGLGVFAALSACARQEATGPAATTPETTTPDATTTPPSDTTTPPPTEDDTTSGTATEPTQPNQ